MSVLLFDTETSGLPDWGAPSDADHQPHLVQLAMVLLDDDLRERAAASVIIRPDGWIIPDEVAAIHGITTEIALAVGIPEKVAVNLYMQMSYGLGALEVAHNHAFDTRIMRIAMLRAGVTKEKLDERKPESFCTMKTTTAMINLPPTAKMVAAGRRNPKPPKLSECIMHFFGEELEGAHDAMVDVRACERIYRHLLAMKARPAEAEEAI